MSGRRPGFPARLDLTSGAPTPARTGLPPLRTPVADAAERTALSRSFSSAPPERAAVSYTHLTLPTILLV